MNAENFNQANTVSCCVAAEMRVYFIDPQELMKESTLMNHLQIEV